MRLSFFVYKYKRIPVRSGHYRSFEKPNSDDFSPRMVSHSSVMLELVKRL